MKMLIPSKQDEISMINLSKHASNLKYDYHFNYAFNYLNLIIENIFIKRLYNSYILIHVKFKEQYKPSCTMVETLVLLVMKLLSEYIYIYTFEYSKIITIYDFYHSEADCNYTFCLSHSVNLTPSHDGQDVPDRVFYNTYRNLIQEQAEKYPKGYINSIYLKIYLRPETFSRKKNYTLSLSEIIKLIYGVYISKDSRIDKSEVISMANKPTIPKFITALNKSNIKLKSFMVADLETIITGLDKEDELYLDEVSNSTNTNEIDEVSNSTNTNEIDVLEDNLQDHPFDTTIIEAKKLKDLQSSLVSKEETLSQIERHVVYAAGFLVVTPTRKLVKDELIETYYIEEKNIITPSLINRSYDMIYEFINRLVQVANKTKIRLVYFHNLSRFDGILIVKALTHNRKRFKFETTMRNHSMYEIKLKDANGVEEVLILRDSYFLLTSSLNDLAANICPELGAKEILDHEKITKEDLHPRMSEILFYMKKDVLLLGGIMQNTQHLYYTKFKVDITNSLTISSLALRIYRMNYYDPMKSPIYIATQNVDKFIRRGYYGGHSDVYKPCGFNLLVYDVNSLYPYIMQEYPMPCGEPVWEGNLQWADITDKLGFVQAYVKCPSSMDRPFLPYRNEDDKKDQTLFFPTGEWIGVYYIPELEKAKSLGYTILPIRGYIYPNKAEINPFKTFVTDIYNSRMEARKEKDSKAMTLIYKLIMNSLYGRFGINPQSTVTEICNYGRYSELANNATTRLVNIDIMNKDYYIVSYKVNTQASFNEEWKPPKNSAVQIAAAITACARIHMYEHISRSDCVYTDTDSIFLENPLNEEFISQSEIGKFKLERTAEIGLFLAPKSYALENNVGDHFIKQKGRAKDLVDFKWFEKTFHNLSSSFTAVTNNSFHIDRSKLIIIKKKFHLKVSLPESQKRIRVIENQIWKTTIPVNIIDKGKEISLFDTLSNLSKYMEKTALMAKKLLEAAKHKEEGLNKTEMKEKSLEDSDVPSKDT